MPRSVTPQGLRRLRADEHGGVSTEYLFITALSLFLAVAIGASATAFESARDRSEELLRTNMP